MYRNKRPRNNKHSEEQEGHLFSTQSQHRESYALPEIMGKILPSVYARFLFSSLQKEQTIGAITWYMFENNEREKGTGGEVLPLYLWTWYFCPILSILWQLFPYHARGWCLSCGPSDLRLAYLSLSWSVLLKSWLYHKQIPPTLPWFILLAHHFILIIIGPCFTKDRLMKRWIYCGDWVEDMCYGFDAYNRIGVLFVPQITKEKKRMHPCGASSDSRFAKEATC